ncbi:MAG: YeeE/YedE thiosulfate transporter family protein [bacterium]
MSDILKQPWSWYVAGILIGLIVPLLLLLGNKSFGVSSSLRHICAACFPSNIKFFKYDWKKETWNLFFVAGIIIGGFIAVQFLENPDPVNISASTKEYLKSEGINNQTGLMPVQIFSWESLISLRGILFIVIGGFIVGFGTRYAGGCTSGHAISGLSNLQLPSLIATVCFMIGGIVSTWLIVPILLKL